MMRLFKTLFSCLFVLALASATGCAGNSTNESAGEYIDDTWITTRVKAALVGDPVVKATEVNVETFKGVVQLSGFVESDEAMNKAVEIAREIPGVSSVENDMRVK
jgi:hyperosmotically inducible protein